MSTSDERPLFSELFKEYLAAFNSKDLTKILAFISPRLTVYYNNNLTAKSRDDTIKSYTDHLARLCIPVVLEAEPRELDPETEGQGVEVSLAVQDEGYRIRVKYFYEQEEGKWMQIRHEIALKEELESST